MIRTFRCLALVLVLAGAGLLLPPTAAAQPSVQMCGGQSVPAGYVVVAVSSRPDCPGYSSFRDNSMTVRMPGDTVTVCTSISTQPPGYVLTASSSSPTCPGYSSYRNNRATYQRVGPPPASAPAAGPGGAFVALDQYDRTVYLRMAEMEEWLRLVDRTHQMWRASAAQGTSAQASLQVQAGVRYTLVAVCDDDCTDLDLRVLDRGYVVAEDLAVDAHARLELAPARDGELTVEVIMAACSNAPCRYGVGVYQTPPVMAIPAGPPPRRERIRPPTGVRPTPQQRP